MSYIPPIRDLTFALMDIAGARALQQRGAFAQFDGDTVAAILEAAGSFAGDVLAPLNLPGDRAGARFANGKVEAPAGFAAAYRQFEEGGWNALAARSEYGGQGLPKALEVCVYEMIQAANMSFGLCPMLTQGAIEALATHGTERQKSLYLPRLVAGTWTGTMNLTEPQAGSDLAALRTRAEPDGAGSHRLFGQKIFITWGDHDMAENIVHLVLARLPGAPEGTRGISLFLSPKRLVSDNGELLDANTLKPASIEHKLGIHGSPTCVMLYEGAKAELIGGENQGLAHMFTMMNAARLHVGVQGVGVACAAYQKALSFSLERRQGRSAWTGEYPARLFDHPDIRRSLMLMKGRLEAARALCLATAIASDVKRSSDNKEEREAASLREEFLTPIAKAWSTDAAVEIASAALQVHGGMGFIEETGIAQFYRDARILPIYEGTNGIQAIDLMGRKLALADGKAASALMDEIHVTATELVATGDERIASVGQRLVEAVRAARIATTWLIERKGHAQPDALAGATAFLQMMGDMIGGWHLAKAALIAFARLGDDPDLYWRGKIGVARVFSDQILGGVPGRSVAVMQGASDLLNTTAEGLGP